MLVKIIILFMIAMIVVALIGRVLFPTALPRVMRKQESHPVCQKCGRYVIGRKPCDCGGKAGGGKAR